MTVYRQNVCALLSEALAILDDADEQLAAIHICHAMDILNCSGSTAAVKFVRSSED